MRRLVFICLPALCWGAFFAPTVQGAEPTALEVRAALRKAAGFFHEQVSTRGGYLWAYSGDLKLREAEGRATLTQAWVQPPGTPSVGEAMLEAYTATQDEYYLKAARASAQVLLSGQLATGGWFYSVNVGAGPGRQRKSTLDDDTTTAAARFLIRLDKLTGFKDRAVHAGAKRALDAMLRVQFPNGAWYMWWDEPSPDRSARNYPVFRARFPKAWPRQWDNKWTGRYFLNDNVTQNMIRTLLLAHTVYGEARFKAAAERAGDFLILAQMPEPQPAWAQQYSPAMEPVWDRKFEPPAITGHESQSAMDVLLLLYEKTGKKKYLKPIPRALAYLKKSRLPNGKLSRFYELRTNKPLFFYRQGKRYFLTYDDSRVPNHYSFHRESRLDAIEAEYKRLLANRPDLPTDPPKDAEVGQILSAMDARGAWVERGRLPHHKLEPASGIIQCQTFIDNIRTLSGWLRTKK